MYRVSHICSTYGLNISSDQLKGKVISVKNVNQPETIEIIKKLSYDVLVINGTRIISKSFLSKVEKPIINTHVGITPKYRGVHGAYWALVNSDIENCGVTVHLVDAGIDTGRVLHQATIKPTQKDNIATYPYLQIAAALSLLKESVENPKPNRDISNLASKLYYHPTLFEYLHHWVNGKF